MNTRNRLVSEKKVVTREIDAELLNEAREQGLDLSAMLERALRKERARKWLAENKDAIDAYNRRIEEHRVWSDALRPW